MKTIQKPTNSLLATLAACGAILAFGLNSAQAADIAWGTPQNITGDSDVSLIGTLVRAVGMTPTEPTVNGVKFLDTLSYDEWFPGQIGVGWCSWSAGYQALSSPVDRLRETYITWATYSLNKYATNPWNSGAPSGLSDQYKTLLNGFALVSFCNSTVMTLGGLTPGQEYLFQLWANDSSGNYGVPKPMYLDGACTVNQNGDGTLNAKGQYVIGRFTAAGTTQTFTITTPGTMNGNQAEWVQGWVSAYQLRATSGATDSGYNAWATIKYGLTDGAAARGADPDGDGFTNLQEFLFGTSPIAGNGTLVTSETTGGNLVLRWLQRVSGSSYLLKESATMGAGDWVTSAVVPANDADQTGVPADYVRRKAVITTGESRMFFRVEGTEN